MNLGSAELPQERWIICGNMQWRLFYEVKTKVISELAVQELKYSLNAVSVASTDVANSSVMLSRRGQS